MGRNDRKTKFSVEDVGEVGSTAEDIFRQAKIVAAKGLYLCAPAIRALRPIFLDQEEVAPGIKMTMGVDKYYRVYVGNKFVLEQVEAAKLVSKENPCKACGAVEHHPLAYVAGTIYHEAWHLVRKHSKREEASGFKNHTKWNIAADLELNDDILEIFKNTERPKLCLPVFAIWPKKFRETTQLAQQWSGNPNKAKFEAITDPVEKTKFLKELSHADSEQLYCWKQVETHGSEVWKLFIDGKLAEEYYMLLPENPPCPVHGPPCESCGVPHGEGTHDDNKDDNGDKGEKGDEEGEGGDHDHGDSDAYCTCPWTTDHGSGVGGEARGYELGPPDAQNPGVSEAEGRIISQQVAKAICEAKKSRGTIPGGLERWADRELAPAKYDWRTELAKACRYGASLKVGCEIRSYRRLGILTGSTQGRIIYPTTYDPIPDVTVVFDTSGSMDEKALKSGLEETDGILKSVGARVRITSVDAAATELTDIENVKDVKLFGGGGTDMRVGIESALSDQRRIPSVIVVMTDGFTPWPDQPLNKGKTALIVCLCGENTAGLESVPDWALGIKIEEQETNNGQA